MQYNQKEILKFKLPHEPVIYTFVTLEITSGYPPGYINIKRMVITIKEFLYFFSEDQSVKSYKTRTQIGSQTVQTIFGYA